MPDRTVSYDFRANFTQFSAGLAAMGKSVEATATKLTALDRNGQKMRAGLTQLGGTAGKIGLVAAAGLGAAVVAAANFEQAMSNVQAATHETSQNMGLLRKAALDAGAATKFSATESAAAIEELAKAGVSTADILGGGLDGALSLAAAGNLDVASAAEIAATAVTQFKLAGEDVPHVADLLAAGAGKAQGEVTDLAAALKQSGLVASQFGLSIEETSGALAAMASNGLIGSDAGTSLKSALLALAAPSVKAQKLMDNLGIAAYDANGQFVGLEALAGQLQTAFAGQSQATRDAALATIFGTDAIRTANVLYTEGASGIDGWTKKVDDAGYAAETAATKMDNLKGDVEQFTGALETALIGAGGGSQGPLRDLVQGATDAVNAFNKLDPAAQNSASALLGITAVTGGALWFGSKVIQGIANTRGALADLGLVTGRTEGSLGRLVKSGAGIATLAGGIALLGQAVAEAAGANVDVDDLGRQIEAVANGKNADVLNQIVNSLGVMSGRQGVIGGTAESINELVTAFGLFGGTAADNAAQNVDQVDKALAALVESGNADQAAKFFEQLAAAQLGVMPGSSIADSSLDGLMENFTSYGLALDNAAASSDEAATATDGLASAQTAAASAAEEQAAAVAEAVQAMEDQRSAALSAFDAITGYRQAMKDAAAQAKSNSEGIKGNSDAALKNRSALSSLAAAWNNQDATVTSNIKKFREARANFIATAEAMGVPTREAKRLANQLFELPQQRVIPISTPGADDAANKARTLKGILDSLKSKDIYVALHYQTIGNKPKAPTPGQSADGGTVPRTGLPYADRHPYLLADGEEVISNRFGQADRHRGLLKSINAGRLADGGTAGGDTSKSKSKSADDRAQDKRRNSVILSFELATIAAAHGVKGLQAELKRLEGQSSRLEKASKRQEEAVQRETAARDALQGRYDTIASTVGGLFNSDIFATDSSADPWSANGIGSDPIALLEADIKNGGIFESLRDQLIGRGLSGSALEESMSKGIPALQALTAYSDADLARFQQLYGDRAGQNARIGAASADSVVGDELAAANTSLNRQTQLQAQELRELKDATNAIREVKAAIEQHDQSNRAGQRENAKDTGAEIKTAGGKGKRDRVYSNGIGGRRH